jgi:hypothetical protein
VPETFDQCFSKTTVIAAGHVRQAQLTRQRMASVLSKGACYAKALKTLNSQKHSHMSEHHKDYISWPQDDAATL